MKRASTTPSITTDTTPRENYAIHNSRDFYKGTSFKMAGEWDLGSHYFNDAATIDFVSFHGALLYCTLGHLASEENMPILKFDGSEIVGIEPNPYWSFVLSGVPGYQGVPGKAPILERDFGEEPRFDDRIIWGYDDTPKEEWQTLCMISDLRGDSISSVDILDSGLFEATMDSGLVLTSKSSIVPEFSVGSVQTVEASTPASVNLSKKSGSSKSLSFSFKIPKGKTTTVEVDPKVDSLPAGNTAAVQTSMVTDGIKLKFAIPRGEKGDKGDENIYVGCEEPPTDTSQIWYDPCENAINGVAADDIVYEAYVKAGGEEQQIIFEQAFRNITNSNVDLSNYYNKAQVDAKIQELNAKITELTNVVWSRT